MIAVVAVGTFPALALALVLEAAPELVARGNWPLLALAVFLFLASYASYLRFCFARLDEAHR